MSTKKVLIGLSIVVVVLVAAVMFAKNNGVIGAEEGIKVAVDEVKKEKIVETVTANGKIYPQTEIKISPEVSGEITMLKVKEGDSVVKGQLLMVINPSIYQSSVERANAYKNQMKANELSAGAGLEQVNAQFIKAEADYNRNLQLYNSDIISAVEFEATEAAYKSAQANLKSANQSVQASKYSVSSANASLNEAYTNLTKTKIFAPINGIVSQLNVELGERVVGTAQMAGTELLSIADLNNMEARVDVGENDILRVANGNTTDIEIDAYRNKTFDGTVTHIAYSTGAGNMMGMAEQVTNFEVKIKLLKSSYLDLIDEEKGHKYPFRPGMSCTVDIKTKETDEVITVPIQAVTTRVLEADSSDVNSKGDDLQEVVFVVSEDNSIKAVKVETGIQDSEKIEILSGLSEGDKVVTGPFSMIDKTLEDGDIVTVVDESELYSAFSEE